MRGVATRARSDRTRRVIRWALALSLGAASLAVVAGSARGQRRGGAARKPRPGSLHDGTAQYQIVIAPGWRQTAAPEGTLVAYQAPDGRGRLAITRVGVGTRRARDAAQLAAQVERGVERATPGFRRTRRRASEAARTPVLDLWYERSADPPRVLSRYLFFDRHSVVLSIGLGARPSRAERRAAEAMLRSFTPFQVE